MNAANASAGAGGGGSATATTAMNSPPLSSLPSFPSTVRDILAKARMVPRDDFASHFEHELGVPYDPSSEHNSQVLLLYHSESAVPTNTTTTTASQQQQQSIPLVESTKEATANCDYLNIVLTDHSRNRRQCTALVGQYESFHIQKLMRLPEPVAGEVTAKSREAMRLDPKLPLRYVGRGATSSGRFTKPPPQKVTQEYWNDFLKPYLNNLDEVLDQLKPIAAEAAGAASSQNSIIVLVCNFGQSELLLNFLCSARARDLDTSSILVFATDEETEALAKSMGVRVFHDTINMKNMPKEAAKRYADYRFRAMMMAKVYCVHYLVTLGYDVLFQDVDVVWYKHPFDYFHNKEEKERHEEYDMYFQDDGNHAIYYAPYSANTGFYYVRSNAKTQYFFNSLLLGGDAILAAKSHQVPLMPLLSEHASLYGLKVKIFGRDTNTFPGGHAFHRRKELMMDIVTGQADDPYIFHMSWTHSKDNKLKFLQQLGEWRVEDKCIQKTVADIVKNEAEAADISSRCCVSGEPVVTCHFRDKPSKIPCKDSPSIDKGKGSWWK